MDPPFLVEYLLGIHDDRLFVGRYLRDYLVYAVFEIIIASINIGVRFATSLGRTGRTITSASLASTDAPNIIYQMLLILLDFFEVFQVILNVGIIKLLIFQVFGIETELLANFVASLINSPVFVEEDA